MEQENNRDLFKEAMRKRLVDEPVHSEAEDLEIWSQLQSKFPSAPAREKGKVVQLWYAYAAACVAFLLVAATASYFFFRNEQAVPVAHNRQKTGPASDTFKKEAYVAHLKDSILNIESQAATPIASPSSSQLVEIKSNGVEEHPLPDGSTATLNTEASIRYASDFKEKRNLSLVGEGYFEVQSDKTHPFQVHFGDHLLEVVGTKFNVRSIPSEKGVEVSVIEGIVKVFAHAKGEGILVKQNEQLVLGGEGAPMLRKVETGNFIAWKTGILKFEEASMSEVARLLSRQYRVHIEVDPIISSCTFTGNLNKLGLENALKIVEMSTSFKIKVNSTNAFQISGSGCQ